MKLKSLKNSSTSLPRKFITYCVYSDSGEKQVADKPDPLDEAPVVDNRTQILVNKGLAKCLSNAVTDSQKSASSESSNSAVVTTDISRQAIAQLFLDLATNQKNRGKLVQDGAMKVSFHAVYLIRRLCSHSATQMTKSKILQPMLSPK